MYLLLVLLILLNVCNGQEPGDENLTVMQLSSKYGYHCEEHTVETEDGYLLMVHRLYKNGTLNPKLLPMLLMHGFLGSSADYFFNGPDKSLPYLLAKKGYDVWLPNNRGNTHSRRHKVLDPDKDQNFWKYSWHEIGIYDIPATIEYILRKTKYNKILYTGLSQGSRVFFVMTSERPEYQKIVKLSLNMAPAVLVNHLRHPLLIFLTRNIKNLEEVSRELNINELLPFVSNEVLRDFGKDICLTMKKTCITVFEALSGGDRKLLNLKSFAAVVSKYPAGASLMEGLHYAQNINSGNFQQYDFGKKENLFRYNSPVPPLYNLNITTPIALFYSESDIFSTKKDVEDLAKVLPNVVEVYKVPNKKFSHFDFVLAEDVIKLIYTEYFRVLDLYK